MQFIILAPIQLAFVVWLLWGQVGWVAVVGPGYLVLCVPLYVYLGRRLKNLRFSVSKITDERVKKMGEVLKGMRVLKMNAWARPFGKLVGEIRASEVEKVQQTNFLRAIQFTSFFITPAVVAFLTFFSFLKSGGVLTKETLFAVISLFNAVRFPMAQGFPTGIQCFSELSVVFSRLQNLMTMDELPPAPLACSDHPVAIEVDELVCSWDAGRSGSTSSPSVDSVQPTPEKTLNGISVSVARGELLVVVGTVGAGKTSLLMALMRELLPEAGHASVRGSIGYAPQEAWILDASVRDNIVFGEPFEQSRYDTTISVCQLTYDLEGFDDGDMTEVGERGVMLSGGQRARISLARAVYANRDIVLLDDPLSAVDAKVGAALMNECVNGALAGKTRVLVTHQLQFAHHADKVLVLENGRSIGFGSYDELLAKGLNLSAAALGDVADTTVGADVVSSAAEAAVSRERKLSELSETNRTRNISGMSATSTGNDDDDSDATAEDDDTSAVGRLMRRGSAIVTEAKFVGGLQGGAYSKYARAAGGTVFATGLMFLFITVQVGELMISYFLKWLVDQPVDERGRSENLQYYGALVGGLLLLTLVRSLLFMRGAMRASTGLHDRALDALLRVPILFIDTHSIGQMLNRFSKDTGFMDDLLPITFLDFIQVTRLSRSSLLVVRHASLVPASTRRDLEGLRKRSSRRSPGLCRADSW